MAGISLLMGGYHIQCDNIAGLELGRTVAMYVFPKTTAYFEGTAKNNQQLTAQQMKENYGISVHVSLINR
ncbi:MAG: hypothetical protein M3209_16295 [Acidobacteriota bacterium]|nr:hypothetical protein [Acidobacteriota bacterium]